MLFEPKRDKYLRLLMYELYYISEIDSFDFNQQKYPDTTDWDACISVLEWSMENTDYDYQKLLPSLRFSNDEIVQYLSLLHNKINDKMSKDNA